MKKGFLKKGIGAFLIFTFFICSIVMNIYADDKDVKKVPPQQVIIQKCESSKKVSDSTPAPLPPAPQKTVSNNLESNHYFLGGGYRVITHILYATGRGAPSTDQSLSEIQRYLLAERAAIADAYRNLSEKIEGFLIEGFTKIGMYEAYADKISILTSSFIKGAQIEEIKHKDNGICEVVVKIALNKNYFSNFRN